MKEVGWGVDTIDSSERRGKGDTLAFTGGAGTILGARVVPGVVGTIEEVLDDLVGSSKVELINIIKL